MLALFETPAGFALFKVLDEGKLSNVEGLDKEFREPREARRMVNLEAFHKFDNESDALKGVVKLLKGAPSKGLRRFLRANCEGETLAVADSKLGEKIKEKLDIDCVHNDGVLELLRGVRSQFTELISDLGDQDLAPMRLALAHSLANCTLGDNGDTIYHTLASLDDTYKSLNKYGMRVTEWYGWHFPELGKIISNPILYVKSVKLMGHRHNAPNLDFSEILETEVEAELKAAAVVSMGTEISDLDMMRIQELCEVVVSLDKDKHQLRVSLKKKMNTVAPNLTALVGHLVGARLISHQGGLLNLSKQPGSRIENLGRHATSKYGFLYHTSVVGQAAAEKHKMKIMRPLAAKVALASRMDALGDGKYKDNTFGLEIRAKIEARLRGLSCPSSSKKKDKEKKKKKVEAEKKDKKKRKREHEEEEEGAKKKKKKKKSDEASKKNIILKD